MIKQADKLEQTKQENKSVKQDYIFALGRRKSSIAEVRIYKKDTVWEGAAVLRGQIFVNKKNALEYFGKALEGAYKEPLHATNTEDKFAISIKVMGGGKVGQLEAVVLGIARGLDKIDREKFHSILKKKGMLTRDPRVRQRRKVGMGGKSRRKKQSPKR